MREVIDDPADWRAEDMIDQSEWVFPLSSRHIAQIDKALKAVNQAGIGIDQITKENFPLENCADLIDAIHHRMEEGRGLVVVRGFPALEYEKQDLRLIYWGLGKHIGTAVSQSSKGDLLGDVRDFGQNPYTSKGRGYMSRIGLGFHTDTADVVALMVLRPAKSGGLSMICSSLAIRNELARTRPDLLEVLYEPLYWSWKGQQGEGELPYYRAPVFSEHNGKFSCRHVITHVIAAQEDFPNIPRLTKIQKEALATVDKMAESPEFHFSMMFEPGDMQFLNNHVTMHARTEFEDFEEEDRKRHLLRMWLSVPNSRELDRGPDAIYETSDAGSIRGGFPSRTGKYSYETLSNALD